MFAQEVPPPETLDVVRRQRQLLRRAADLCLHPIAEEEDERHQRPCLLLLLFLVEQQQQHHHHHLRLPPSVFRLIEGGCLPFPTSTTSTSSLALLLLLLLQLIGPVCTPTGVEGNEYIFVCFNLLIDCHFLSNTYYNATLLLTTYSNHLPTQYYLRPKISGAINIRV